jgi:hypothetical protein
MIMVSALMEILALFPTILSHLKRTSKINSRAVTVSSKPLNAAEHVIVSPNISGDEKRENQSLPEQAPVAHSDNNL